MSIEEKEKSTPEEWKKNPPHLDGVADMSALIYLEGPNVLHNLECRYKKGEIYTSISKVLIAVNPYASVVDYSGKLISQYRQAASKKRQTLPPHVFSVSQLAYYNLVKFKENQSLIVCGESGSGKTESAKHLMRYLAYTPDEEKKGGVSIEQRVLDANPILESFGNAKTCLNWNSSRFGKFTKIVFTSPNQDRIVGSFIETYLLEKSRVVRQDTDERNYHVFYYITTPGTLKSEQADAWGMAPADNFHYTRQGGAIKVKEISDTERYEELLEAFKTLGFTPEEQKEVLQIVAGILHLGNVSFTPNDKDLAEITTEESKAAMDQSAALFQIPKDGLLKRLTTATLKVRDSAITKTMSLADAIINRDAISKALYHGLFEWVVYKINSILFEENARAPDLKWIGILDVFGFESFEHNSFEQFCINFANERLQQYFNLNIIKSEQDLYRAESILWTPIKIADNQDVIDLIDGKQRGVLLMLDNTCKMPKGDAAAFIRNLFQMNKFHPRMKEVKRVRNSKTNEIEDVNGFSIRHYAGLVVYDAADFLSKNMDQTQQDTLTLFCEISKGAIISTILEDEDMRKEKERKKAEEAKKAVAAASGVKNRFSQFEQKAPVRSAAASSSGPRKAETSFKSVGNYFSSQLEKLMTTLYQTTPFFVRCIKPNAKKKAAFFDWDYVRPQLECGGIIEALRILKCGYPSRCGYEDIFARYGKIMKPTPPNLNKRDFCEAVLRNAGETLDRNEFQLGLSKVFFRPGKQAFLEELLEGEGELPLEVVSRIKFFLLNKRLSRGRGAIRVHIMFKLRLRQMRAFRAVWKLFHLVKNIATFAFVRLRRIRNRLAAQALQAHIMSHFHAKELQTKKKAALSIGKFYTHNRFRRRLVQELRVRIEKKRASMKEAERVRRVREEAERKEQEAREAADVAKRIAREAEEKRRLEKEKLEEEVRERERIAREQREKERKEMERKEMEMQQALAKAKELEKKLKEEKEKAEADLKAQLDHDKSEIERLRKEEEERKLALDLREFELNEREKNLQTLAEAKSKETVDQMVHLVKRGTLFFRHEGNIEEANTVTVTVTEEGVLRWVEQDTVTEGGVTPQGDIKLHTILKVKNGTNTSEEIGKDVNLFLTIEYKGQESEAEPQKLELQAGTPEMRDKWVTALRYCVRNIKELNTISRPTKDLARGNILAAMLTDELNEQKEKNKKLKSRVGELEQAMAASSASAGSAAVSPEDAKLIASLKEQVEYLKRKNLQYSQAVKKEKARRQNSEQQTALTSLLEEKKKILKLEEKNQQYIEENKRLRERVQVLQEELDNQRALRLDDHNNAKLREEQLRAEVERKLHEAKEGVQKAESAVIDAEAAVRKRQDVIRNAMKLLSDRKGALQNTEQTMSVLGIVGRAPEELSDPTARRLAELHRQQKKEQQEAEAVLLKEYAAMVAEAEALNEVNEDLARKTYIKEKNEELMKKVEVVEQQRKPGANVPSALAGKSVKGPVGPGVPGEPGKQGEEVCIIS